MARISITKRTVDAASAGTKDQFLWDREIAGFGIKITPAGKKIYVFQYRLARPGQAAQTAARRYTIGRHGALTAEQARKRAWELAAMVAGGVDPKQREADAFAAQDEAKRNAEEQVRLEGELIFDKIAARWLDHYENEKDRRPSSVRMAALVVGSHLTPKLRGIPMPHIGRASLQAIIDAIPAKQKGMRRAVFAYASVLFGWASKRCFIEANPLSTMAKPEAPKARERVLSDDEVTALWKASESVNKPFGAFFRLLILSGQRRSEVAGLNWDELDRASAVWIIPAARAKNGVAHIVPLAPEVIAELDQLAGVADEDERIWPRAGYALTTTGKTPISGITKAKDALDLAVKTERKGEALPLWRIHDLRRTMATGFQRLGIRFEVTEATLNHVSGAKSGVAGIYQKHDWKEEKRSALEAWARHILGLQHSSEGGNVRPLRVVSS